MLLILVNLDKNSNNIYITVSNLWRWNNE